jgi:hypothetical protein
METSNANIWAILISATGGAFISACVGFFTTIANNKNKIDLLKEQGRYEYAQFRSQTLFGYLEELERECYLISGEKNSEVIERAEEVRTKIKHLLGLSTPSLNEQVMLNLQSLNNIENEKSQECFRSSEIHLLRKDYVADIESANAWLESLSDLRTALRDALTGELIEIRRELSK